MLFLFCLLRFGSVVSPELLICSLISALSVSVESAASAAEIEKHVELGKEMMARGQLQDALTHFHAALEGDPGNYLTLYRRATVYLGLGRAKLALDDINRVLEIKPDFIMARSQKGSILLKMGRLDEAHIELEKVVSCLGILMNRSTLSFNSVYLSQLTKDPKMSEAATNYFSIENLKKDYMNAQMFFSDNDYYHAADLITKIIESCPWDIRLREMRSESYLAIGESSKAITDLKAASKLMSDNTVAFLKISKLYYTLGNAEESLK